MNTSHWYIGLMSGTSADAIDAALVDFSGDRPKIIRTHSTPIPDELRQSVFALAESGQDEINTMRRLDQRYAELFSRAVKELCNKAQIIHTDVVAIGSHGQTIRHIPPTDTALGYSLQIGDPNIIAERTCITTVADFRRRDIAAGGHGAPLAPAFHHAVFRSGEKNRIILNLGGVANMTYLPKDGETIGFDTGPANNLMDSWTQLNTGRPYDKDGHWAMTGKPVEALLKRLLKHPYLHQSVPKSTGRESFNLNWLHREISAIESCISPENIQATLLAFTVEATAKAIEATLAGNKQTYCEIYCCGGGTHNKALINALTKRLHPNPIDNTCTLGISADWVEAVAFAWLAKQTLEGLTGNLMSVTGARQAAILGGIYPAQ